MESVSWMIAAEGIVAERLRRTTIADPVLAVSINLKRQSIPDGKTHDPRTVEF